MTPRLDAIRERDAAYDAIGFDLSNPRNGREQMAADRHVLLAEVERLRSGSLDEAWAEAEAALPEGWFIGGLTNHGYRGQGERWLAQAYDGPVEDANYRTFKAEWADTPAAALHALAAKLREAKS